MKIMTKLTKSLLVIKERNCTASLVLDIKWLYYSKSVRQFSLIIAVCIWVFSLCFTGFLLYDNAKLSLENEKNMLIRKTLGTDKKNRKQIMYIDMLYSHKEYHKDEISKLLKKFAKMAEE